MILLYYIRPFFGMQNYIIFLIGSAKKKNGTAANSFSINKNLRLRLFFTAPFVYLSVPDKCHCLVVIHLMLYRIKHPRVKQIAHIKRLFIRRFQ